LIGRPCRRSKRCFSIVLVMLLQGTLLWQRR